MHARPDARTQIVLLIRDLLRATIRWQRGVRRGLT
jgi:hypothetical protein